MTQEVKLDELYQEVILDHNRRPRNFGKLDDATHYAHGHNPLCGDDYHLYLKIDENGKIQKITFEGSGCAISKSSASMMTTFLEGKNGDEAEKLGSHFIGFMTKDTLSKEDREAVGRLKLFEGVRHFPVRVKCATLAWQALLNAVTGK
ncbi:MAG: SUF system NifU family Fe-S cluster assembly protein [Candidatus Omnitrophica bacterium]|nr:SUF system NifU family Fe-S cluster assembly protein [Candidatus Omnitrophota bacterium]